MEGSNFRVKNGSPGSCVGGRIAKAKRDVNKIFQKFCRSFSRSSCTGVKAAISAPGVQRFRTIHHRPQFVGAGGCAGVDWERIRDRCVSSNFHPKSRKKRSANRQGSPPPGAAYRGEGRSGARHSRRVPRRVDRSKTTPVVGPFSSASQRPRGDFSQRRLNFFSIPPCFPTLRRVRRLDENRWKFALRNDIAWF